MGLDRGFWQIEGPHHFHQHARKWRAMYYPYGKSANSAGIAWAESEDKAREKALRRAKLKNKTKTMR